MAWVKAYDFPAATFAESISEVKEGKFPTDDHVYHIIEPEEDFEKMFREFS